MSRKLVALLLSILILQHVHSQQFKVSYTDSSFEGPFSGKVFLYMSKDKKEPRNVGVGIEFFPAMSIDLKNIKPRATVTFDDRAISFPVKLSEIERGEYYVQVVWDRNLGGRAIAQSPGNMFSRPEKVMLTKDFSKTYTITCSETVPEPIFKETQFIKELKAPSALLSSFHKKTMTVDAAILLPREYFNEPQRSFPVLFHVTGYGGDYRRFSGDTISRSWPLDSVPCITVYLDGNCPLGHSVYANSDNNGPWGDALIKEFIPLLEKNFRCNGARFVRGHSSGGWTVLYLQSHYPTVFAGCWASSPDPVDFRDYQKINLYEKENMIYDKQGNLRMVGTVAGYYPWASSKQAYQEENVIYRGEQMHSFDAVFSGRGADGNPERICDPFTGVMNEKVFEHWKNYDLSLYLRTNWDKLKKDLDGKIRVSIGEQDNFLLQGAVHLLEKEMKALNANMNFEYFPGDHFTVGTAEYRDKGYKFLSERYKEWQKENLKGF